MKKIGKLSINPEKVLKNEELINLKGGTYTFWCVCYEGGGWQAEVDDTEELVEEIYNHCNLGGHCEPW